MYVAVWPEVRGQGEQVTCMCNYASVKAHADSAVNATEYHYS